MYGIPVEVWMCLGEEVIGMLCRVYLSRRIVSLKWIGSVIVPIYKEKCDMQDCVDCRGIQLIHTLNIWESVIERWLRDKQFGSCQVEGRRMRYPRCGNVWRNIGENRGGYLEGS